jgi:hypothetical protein
MPLVKYYLLITGFFIYDAPRFTPFLNSLPGWRSLLLLPGS